MSKLRTTKFIDSLKLLVAGGRGGDGLAKYNGIGGNGGSIIAKAALKTSLNDVYKLYMGKKVLALPGENSKMFALKGQDGRDTFISVPVGTQFYAMNYQFDKWQEFYIGEVDKVDQQLLLAKGGCGGTKETFYSGQPGKKTFVRFDLKLLADVGLVGFPNAGKSTLLKAISNANPKIANYPFTTLKPQLGMIQYPDLRQISMVDLPGLIEGASQNHGLGHTFLKHIERTKLLVYIIDVFGFTLDLYSQFRSPLDCLNLLTKEVQLYDPALLDRPAILLINKIDLNPNFDVHGFLNEYKKGEMDNKIKFDDVIPISAKRSINIETVKDKLRHLLDDVAVKAIQAAI